MTEVIEFDESSTSSRSGRGSGNKIKHGDWFLIALDFVLSYLIFELFTISKKTWNYMDFAFVLLIVAGTKVITALTVTGLRYGLKNKFEFAERESSLEINIYKFTYLIYSLVFLSALIIFFKVQLFGPQFNDFDYLIARLFTLLLAHFLTHHTTKNTYLILFLAFIFGSLLSVSIVLVVLPLFAQ